MFVCAHACICAHVSLMEILFFKTKIKHTRHECLHAGGKKHIFLRHMDQNKPVLHPRCHCASSVANLSTNSASVVKYSFQPLIWQCFREGLGLVVHFPSGCVAKINTHGRGRDRWPLWPSRLKGSQQDRCDPGVKQIACNCKYNCRCSTGTVYVVTLWPGMLAGVMAYLARLQGPPTTENSLLDHRA
jgi:hypothetical protein